MFQVVLGDCRALISAQDTASIDAIITDPPYEIAFASWDRSGIAHDVGLWREALRVLKPGGYLLAFACTRTYHPLAMAIERAGFDVRDMLVWLYSNGMPRGYDIGAAMPDAQGDAWAGWYSTLKPCLDPICLARKPFPGTVMENIATWGVGAFNVEACRVHDRRPGNVLLDDGAVSAYARDYGTDLSRFFYCGKATPNERQAGCDAIGGNPHPCVKPLALMRYLCRLVTPRGGLVLDPFAGSGSTGCAAVLEGCRFLGYERDAAYCAVSLARMAHWQASQTMSIFDL